MIGRMKLKYLIIATAAILILKFFGVFTHIFEKDFYNDFHYPYDGDVHESVQQLRHNIKPDITPINTYNYSYLINADTKCKTSDRELLQPRLVYIVKSAMAHFDRRITIRNTWGYEHRFSDVIIRTVFILGINDDINLLENIKSESQKYGDIVQSNFIDSYFNNTVKTMMGFKWAVHFCPQAKFYMFVDDDMYVSTKNALLFVRNPTNYPAYLKEPVFSLKLNQVQTAALLPTETRSKRKRSLWPPIESRKSVTTKRLLPTRRPKRQVMDFELPDDVRLYSGYVFISAPHRHKTSKWHVALEEYPYHMWPPYVTAGSYILSREALHEMYYASYYTKHFRFDDVYLGLVAMKANIEPYHCNEFHFYKKTYSTFGYAYVVASHGYEDSEELLKIWNEQKSTGHA